MILFAAYVGCRPGELFALELADLHAGYATIARSADSKTRSIGATKNGEAREVVYPARVQAEVEAIPDAFAHPQLVFATPTGKQLWASSFSWLWKPVKCAFGRPRMDFYELRHFCATHMLAKGLSAFDVSVQLGHRDGGTLVQQVYGHPSERDARRRIAAALA